MQMRTKRKASRNRNERTDAWYSTTEWRTIRHRQLTDQPDCATCGAEATVVDHVIPRAQLIAQGVPDPDDPAFLQSLCAVHHNRKTATTDGGFGRTVKPLEQR